LLHATNTREKALLLHTMAAIKTHTLTLALSITGWSLCLFSGGCRTEPEARDADVAFVRLEQELFDLRGPEVPDSARWQALETAHGDMLSLYCHEVIRSAAPGDTDLRTGAGAFVNDSLMYQVYQKVQATFPTMKPYETALSDALGRAREAFPGRPLPRLYTMISGFNQALVSSDSLLAIALDKYLGPEEPLYTRLGYPEYMTRTMRPEYLARDCVMAWLYTEFAFNDSVDNVLSHLLYHGRTMYLTSRLMPDMPDTLLTGFTRTQLEWCQQHEEAMWTFLAGEQMLFSTDYNTIRRLTGTGPFTAVFSMQAPARAAVWLGYRIVASFVEHKKPSLQELSEMTNYRDIMNRAVYQPEKPSTR